MKELFDKKTRLESDIEKKVAKMKKHYDNGDKLKREINLLMSELDTLVCRINNLPKIKVDEYGA
jgi:cell division protein FtsB